MQIVQESDKSIHVGCNFRKCIKHTAKCVVACRRKKKKPKENALLALRGNMEASGETLLCAGTKERLG